MAIEKRTLPTGLDGEITCVLPVSAAFRTLIVPHERVWTSNSFAAQSELVLRQFAA